MIRPLVLGVDPGASGALATIDRDGHLVELVDMPVVERDVSAALLGDLLDRLWPDVAFVERAQAMPNQGSASGFRYGVGYGVILGVLAAHHVPVHHVSPAKWKRTMRVTKDKGSSRRKAIDLWPSHAQSFARVKDDGRAEAALIAEYGRRQLREGQA